MLIILMIKNITLIIAEIIKPIHATYLNFLLLEYGSQNR